MPAQREIRGLFAFLLRFLDFVFAEVGLSGERGGAHVSGAEGLRNRNETDAGGIAAGPVGGARDAIANVRQPGGQIGHYYFGN